MAFEIFKDGPPDGPRTDGRIRAITKDSLGRTRGQKYDELKIFTMIDDLQKTFPRVRERMASKYLRYFGFFA